MEIRVKGNGCIVVEQTAQELRQEILEEFEKRLQTHASDYIRQHPEEEPCREGHILSSFVSRCCHRLADYHLDAEDTMLILRSVVDLCERWNTRQEPPA